MTMIIIMIMTVLHDPHKDENTPGQIAWRLPTPSRTIEPYPLRMMRP